MKRGTIAWINLEDTYPPEFGKTRPAVIVSNSIQNEHLTTVVVVPLSSRAPEIWPLRIKLGGLTQKGSFAVVPGIRQISKTRVQRRIAQASVAFMQRLDEAIRMYLAE
jgi:mRNA interferase MazF